ncbi:hypothetical protein [Flavihumibacter fluvii]|uniref:hypothetical protein n=1 Tax=Flavihumibacter fluvii TaxID=2838157 RepID=UPI001BDED201|nr:hypothetical protein [Flavihumibacter fluvii]ULQ53910.1 hypothetical protein KJS93_06205 [Flavihumibacter fluvii]
MKYTLLIATSFLCTVIYAQPAATDSADFLKKEKISLALQQKITEKEQSINQNKLKLIELEKTSGEKSTTSDEATKTSAESMNKNTEAANKLENNANDKKYARRSFFASKKARRDAKKARKATINASDAVDDITSLKEKIEKEEKELAELKAQVIDEPTVK